jgi:predicted permease
LTTELLRRAEAIPGVQTASASLNATLANQSGIHGFRFNGRTPAAGVERAQANWVAPRYFETLGIAIVDGREFLPSDRAQSPRVAIINRTMALRYVGTERAVGRRFVFNGESYEIVGVARDSKYSGLRDSTPPFVYFAALQSNSAIHSLEVRTAVSPLAVSREIRRVVRDADPRLRVFEVATLEQRIDQMLAREVLIANLAGFFGGLTLVLVILGVYGTLAYSVARRSKEIGIRIALGARPSSVAGTIMGDVLIVGAVGLLFGLMATLAVGQLLGSLLFGLQPADPMTLGLAAIVLSLATLAAGGVPVLRAVRADPTIALRLE